ncbi:hypothetical protein [Pseudonocardia asaccharolytica]|uniref:Uncharacterized protein n=1 Tax=Pseudonocardia asaccharolytica DSM 44247 = NBRC 16224 TaxID=1123024 RepID=A0A511DBI6_9PSEU|nr:hypothetical protein PA7_41350 [Pseudonocardia asaccharolytica DSM 44247 = NBRC 16224]
MSVTVVVDLIHVLEYLWGAVWCFFTEGDGAAGSARPGALIRGDRHTLLSEQLFIYMLRPEFDDRV